MRFAGALSMFHGNNERVGVGSVTLTENLIDATIAQFGQRIGSEQ
jgi:hypothetical protein